MPPKSKVKATASSTSSLSAQTHNVVLELTFPSIPVMSAALARFSAFIEDPEYENIPLSAEEMRELNRPSTRYAGHNFPLPLFDQALPKLGQLNDLEKVVVRAIQEFSRHIRPRTNGYIIAYITGDESTAAHEKQHACFYFNPDFQTRVAGIWASVSNSYPAWAEQFKVHLSNMYCERVHIDEFQAIISNREYECVQKVQQLVASVVPKPENYGYTITKVVLPKFLPIVCDNDDEKKQEHEEI